MRILLLNQFYAPDIAPTGQFLSDLAGVLARRGHEVHVACSRGSYDGQTFYPQEESRDGVHVHRLGGPGLDRRRPATRLVEYGSFYIRLFASALWRLPRPDLVVSLTTPPYLGLLAAVVTGIRGGRLAHWIMDVYPDALAAHGMLRRHNPIYRLLQALARLQYRNASCVLTLGPFMAEAVKAYSSSPDWVPLWGSRPPNTPELSSQARRRYGWHNEPLVLMYSGNMGLGHRFQEFLTAAARLGPSGPVWAFAGGGARRSEIELFAQSHPTARVTFLPYVPIDEIADRLLAADVHLVSLSTEWQGVLLPSKIHAILSSARPAIFVGSRNNEVAQWIELSGGGWNVGEGDVDGLLLAIAEAYDPDERARRGAAALAFAREYFDATRNVAAIATLLESRALPLSRAKPGRQ